MDQQSAVELISDGVNLKVVTQEWADLGSGRGTFTLALAELLPKGSIIHAIDKDKNALEAIPDNRGEISVQKHSLDFNFDKIPFMDLDGVLMANSLHYSNRKSALLSKIHSLLKLNGNLIIIEYEALNANPMVPFPISRSELIKLMEKTGFKKNIGIGKMRSRYGHMIYSVHGRKS